MNKAVPAETTPQRDVLTVSSRGQITLPSALRKQLGITPGGAVIVEAVDGELRLKPAAVFELEVYGEAQIAAWDRADQLSADERQRILERLPHR
ncbi:AbrB/MazE/SpoVT family DNA-binding domain-containing protein [Cyanobium sp. Aljojuca 7D2]|uniref:AbrB/MazE/SpoVT family DNA-binding domain-containing protein n=1 Tax=Cyanobium sp. Aljojuca 7D2 TaxID=2823698 RepID=UPI0020CC62E8|nr:AbrB/MazE/SpoVT family DNA-binding domain-containing protein [Cyanobium sp. Aljojuca 7D2]MCP9890247.1 AbrB/MazE/SpoVT family DNA-binding domain-containing protein [Cyanobium sp. Aljojuca 7D2]